LPKGRARGLAIHESFGTIVGEVAEIAISPKGVGKVERVVAGVDCGHVVNPRHVEMQIESGILYGLTAALFGEITIKDGRVEQSNFDTYQIARIAGASSSVPPAGGAALVLKWQPARLRSCRRTGRAIGERNRSPNSSLDEPRHL
jgi:Molybdopterin-binding domain of aldehyde dehydrogenase